MVMCLNIIKYPVCIHSSVAVMYNLRTHLEYLHVWKCECTYHIHV